MGGTVLTLSDISKHKAAEDAMRHAKEAAEAASRAKSQFLANMSHELRTPMTGLFGMFDLILDGPLEEGQRAYLNTAYGSARSLLRIINDILDLTKLQAGKLNLLEEPFALRPCLENLIGTLEQTARTKEIELALSVSQDVPRFLVGDQVRLIQVLTNLAANAIKFTEKGRVALEVEPSGRRDDGRWEIRFAVIDTGIGIAQEQWQLLFHPFSQADASHTRKYGGTGSTFHVTIPFAEVREMDDAGQAAAASLAGTGQGRRLLVAEDDAIIRSCLQVMFQRANFRVDVAEDGMQAVELWERGCYDAVLMDVQMPRLNGFEAVEMIREKEASRGSHTPIVAMTAHATKEDQDECLAAGMDAYLSKPIDFKESLELIHKMVQEHGGESRTLADATSG